MATNDYFFFTDTNIEAQDAPGAKVDAAAGAYGPVVSSLAAPNMDEYRVTSLHSATANPTAYATCDAIVCVQKVTADPTLVNIILKPLVQPALNFSPVKYIIYKGILANSVINGMETASAGNNDLTKSIWKSQTIKNVVAGTNATPSSQALGAGLTSGASSDFDDAQPIDNLFYRTAVDFQLPVVKGGWSLGQFDKNRFGMEVLMEGFAFHHPLSLARQVEDKISVAKLTGSETDALKFDHWHAKEQVLGFMNPCAFYGSFFVTGIQAKTSGNTPFVLKAGNDLYQDVLFPFANRNTAYLDIRNEHNFSLNYFKNYGNLIKLGSSSAPVDYYASKWPIQTLSATDFPVTNTTARNVFSIQLPVGDNPQPLVYVSQGYRDINAKGDQFPAELTSAERFYDTFEAPVGGYTATKGTSALNSLAFAVPNVAGQVATTPVSCYIRLKYFKQQQGATTVPTVIKSANYLDNLVYPLDLRVLFSGTANIKSSLNDEEIYVNARNVPGLQFDAVCKLGIARDADSTSFFVVPTVMRTNDGPASSLVTLSGETSEDSEAFANLIASKYPLVRVSKSDLVLSATDLAPIAEFVSDADTAALSKFGAPDFSKFLIFVVANSTYDAWKSRLAATGGGLDSRFRVYLGVTNLQTQTDTLGVPYTSFELVLRGFAADATTNNYKVEETGTDPADSAANITVYTSAPAAVTCSITLGADGMSSACVPVGGIIQLTAVPSFGSGTYQWSTASSKIMLNNTATQTVTVQAKNSISASRGAETVQLVFTPTGGTPLPPITRDVTVIKVEFSASTTQNYGYDNMDNAEPPHVSVERDQFTTVHVDIKDHATADDLDFVCDDVTIADVTAPAAGAGTSFELTIEGKNQTKAETSIHAVSKGGPICATIKVNVYREVTMAVTITRIEDPTTGAATLLRPSFNIVDAEKLLNEAFKSAVARVKLDDAGAGSVVPVHYDLDGSGALTFEPPQLGQELTAIDHVVTGLGQQVVVVKQLQYMYYLQTAAAKDDLILALRPYPDHFFGLIEFNRTYILGSEPIEFTSQNPVNKNVFNLKNKLASAHVAGEGFTFPLAALSGHRALVYEKGTDDLTTQAMGHELGHQFGLADLDDDSNVMNWEAKWTAYKLRFKALPRKRGGGTQSQWEVFQR